MRNSTEQDDADSDVSNRDLIIIVLSIYVLLALLVDVLLKLPPEISRLIIIIDDIICIFFLIDFGIRFAKAGNKLRFMKWGWIDLISSIPSLSYLRVGRVFRLLRLLRVLRAFRSTKHLISYLFKDKAKGTATTVLIIAILMVIFSSIAILSFEREPNSTIVTSADAILWSFFTLLTVGYGDIYPVTVEGRIIAVLLTVTGVTIFSVITGYFAKVFIGDKRRGE